MGVAEGGIPVDYAHNLTYINGSPDWSGVLPATLVALGRAFKVNIAPYLSPYGKQLAAQVQSACIGSFEGAYPGLTVQQLVKKKYSNVFSIPALVKINNRLIMGSTPGNPTGPLFMGVGNADGTGDGIMVVADVEALATEYCGQGVGVTWPSTRRATIRRRPSNSSRRPSPSWRHASPGSPSSRAAPPYRLAIPSPPCNLQGNASSSRGQTASVGPVRGTMNCS